MRVPRAFSASNPPIGEVILDKFDLSLNCRTIVGLSDEGFEQTVLILRAWRARATAQAEAREAASRERIARQVARNEAQREANKAWREEHPEPAAN